MEAKNHEIGTTWHDLSISFYNFSFIYIFICIWIGIFWIVFQYILEGVTGEQTVKTGH